MHLRIENDVCLNCGILRTANIFLIFRYSVVDVEVAGESNLRDDMFRCLYGAHDRLWFHCVFAQVLRDAVLSHDSSSVDFHG